MEIIVSHNNTDFDGLASMIAAKKIYPEAELVYAGKLSQNVAEFMALHKDTFVFKTVKEIQGKNVSRLIIVDTKNRNRIGEIRTILDNPGVDIHIYDHHPKGADDISGSLEVIAPVGAATTLMVEAIRQKGIEVNSFEATILALGIYEDTDCLTYETTTSRDADSVAYLLSKGAKLSIVAEFIDRPLSEEQKALLNKLIIASETFDVAGVKVVITSGEVAQYIGGLALLTHKLIDIVNAEAAFAVVHMDDRVHIVARSNAGIVDVSRLMAMYNGGGHRSAASAVVKDGRVEQIVSDLKALLKDNIHPETTAETIMTSPVKTVAPDKSIDEAAKILLRYGHTGLPVVDGDKLLGIISRRDIEKAKHHGLGHAPVKGFMSVKVVTVSGQSTISEIQGLMIDHNIGRLPVIKDGRIIGIVSRTDVLRTLHGDNYPGRYERVYNITQPINCIGDSVAEAVGKLPLTIRKLLATVSRLADHAGLPVFAVGGFVRDLILGVENLDIDLVVEGDGPAFARELAEAMHGKVRIHEKFGTAMVILPDKLRVDVATARTEYYEYPAALPKVEESTLKQDLYRRDFTVNAMAFTLSEENFGAVIDYFGGRRDLDGGIIRVLYNLSFVEDPTRIVRAVRFEQRYGFRIESQTFELARRAIKEDMLSKLSSDRVREEIKHILGETSPLGAILRMEEMGIWPCILPEAVIDSQSTELIRRIPLTLGFLKGLGISEITSWVVYLAAMIKASGCQPAVISERLKLTSKEQCTLTNLLCQCPEIMQKLSNTQGLKMSEVAFDLRHVSNEGYVYMLAGSSNDLLTRYIKDYLVKLRHNKSLISGEDIKNMGYTPGPMFKKLLDAALDARLDGVVNTREEELTFVRNLLKDLEH